MLSWADFVLEIATLIKWIWIILFFTPSIYLQFLKPAYICLTILTGIYIGAIIPIFSIKRPKVRSDFTSHMSPIRVGSEALLPSRHYSKLTLSRGSYAWSIKHIFVWFRSYDLLTKKFLSQLLRVLVLESLLRCSVKYGLGQGTWNKVLDLSNADINRKRLVKMLSQIGCFLLLLF